MVEVEWAPSASSVFLVAIQVEALDRSRLLSDVTRVLSDQHVNILSASVTTTRDRVAISPVHLRDGRPQAPRPRAQGRPRRRRRLRRLPRHQRPSPDRLSRLTCGLTANHMGSGSRQRSTVDAQDRALDRRLRDARARPPGPAPCRTRRPVRRAGRGAPGRARPTSTQRSLRPARRARSWRDVSVVKRARVMFALPRPRSSGTPTSWPGSSAAEHGKVLADARGEVTRGLEVVEFACGIPHLLKGEYSEQVSRPAWTRTRSAQPLGVVAGITPFNFPVMVPMWMHPIAIAMRQRVRPQAERAGPVGVHAASPSSTREAGLPGRRLQRRARRQGGRRRDPRPPRASRRCRSSGRRRSRKVRATSAGIGRRQAGAGPRRGEEPRGRAPGRRPGLRRRATSSRPATGRPGQRCMAISAVVAVGRRRRRAGREGRKALHRAAQGRARPATRPPRWGRSITREAQERVRGYIDARRSTPARRWSSTAVTLTVPVTRTASSSAPACSTTSRRTWTCTPTRSSARSSSVLRADTFDEAVRAGQREPVRQRHRDLHLERRGGSDRSSAG